MTGIVNQAFRRAYRELVTDRRKHMPFWVLVGFLPTYVIARLTVYTNPHLFLNVHGVHVHHFTYGIIVLAIVGFVAIAWPQLRMRAWLAFTYGIGLALSFDEFGMWVHLTSNYNLDQSEDIMSGLLAFLVIAVYCTGIIRKALLYLPHGYMTMRFGSRKSSKIMSTKTETKHRSKR
jgi:hypothetical protein